MILSVLLSHVAVLLTVRSPPSAPLRDMTLWQLPLYPISANVVPVSQMHSDSVTLPPTATFFSDKAFRRPPVDPKTQLMFSLCVFPRKICRCKGNAAKGGNEPSTSVPVAKLTFVITISLMFPHAKNGPKRQEATKGMIFIVFAI